MLIENVRWILSILLITFAALQIAHNYWCAIREFILKWDPITQPLYAGFTPQLTALVGLGFMPSEGAWKWVWIFVVLDPAMWILVMFFPRIIKNSRR